MVEARNKRTREVKVFAPETWEMMEKSGLARRNWDFVRHVRVVVPPEVMWEAAEEAMLAAESEAYSAIPEIVAKVVEKTRRKKAAK